MFRWQALVVVAAWATACTKSNEDAGDAGRRPFGDAAASDAGSVPDGAADGAPDPTGDRDDDGVADLFDNCPRAANHDQADDDGDGAGEVCDVCPGLADPDQADADGDGVGDRCDADDDDGDGLPAAQDNCPQIANPTQADGDNDGRGDACDNCPDDPNFSQADGDGDGIGDACEVAGDDDADGVADDDDNCRAVANPGQADGDNDGRGDACDNCPDAPNFSQADGDGDGVGDACDTVDRDAGPPGRDAGPPERDGSPPERDGSPPERDGSPPERDGSPPERDARPPEEDAAPSECRDGQRRCDGAGTAQVCRGQRWVDEPCAAGRVCDEGVCAVPADPCDAASGHLGCDFFALQLPNVIHDPGEQGTTGDAPMGVVIHNPDADRAATVDILAPDGRPAIVVAEELVGVPQDLGMHEAMTVRSEVTDGRGNVVRRGIVNGADIEIPAGGVATILFPVEAPPPVGESLLRSLALRIRADRPVGVWQHNPICCTYSFSNEGSLLYPVSALGRDYRFLGLPPFAENVGFPGAEIVFPGALVVVGTRDDTDVTVDLPVGAVIAAPRAPLRLANQRLQATIDAHQALIVQTPAGAFGAAPPDLSGAHVTSSAPVAVFSSHYCTRFPDGQIACDHVEEQLLPTTRWGRRFVLAPHAARFSPRPASDRTHWKIAAGSVETRITLSADVDDLAPGIPGFAGVPDCTARSDGARTLILPAGGHCELATSVAFSMTASAPILVLGVIPGHQAAGGGEAAGEIAGDPAIFTVTPVEHWRRSYDVVPNPNYRFHFATVALPVGVALRRNGALYDPEEAPLRPVTGDDHRHAAVPAGQQLQRFSADEPFGLYWFGWDEFIGYAWPGGSAF